MALLAGLRLLRRSPLRRGPFGRDPSGAPWLGLAVAHRWLDRWEARFELLRRWAAALLMVAVLALAGSHAFGPSKPMLARSGGTSVKRPLRQAEAGEAPFIQVVARAVALNAGIGVLALGEARHVLYGNANRG